jgi:Lon-like protease
VAGSSVRGAAPLTASHPPIAMQTTTTPAEINIGPTETARVPTSAGPSRARRYWIALGASGAVLLAALLAISVIEIPYASLSPGSARATTPLVSVEGAPTFPTEGEILFLTVAVDDDVTVLDAAVGWVDPDTVVLPREDVFGRGVSEQQNREANAAAMVGSKETAAVVALTRLGYQLQPTGTGAVVVEITEDTPAADALVVADTIVGVDGVPVRMPADLTTTITNRAPGDTVTLTVEGEDGEQREESVTLAARQDDPARGFLGVATEPRNFDPGLPFGVDIDSGRVGGPSAGLAFTLAILDVLTEGELTGGHQVAVTGTISEDGTVGPVGGVVQKAAAAASAGAEMMLVPPAELEAAEANDHGMRIVGVATLEDALNALVELGGDPLPPPVQPAT